MLAGAGLLTWQAPSARADDPTMTAHVAGRAWTSTRAFVVKTALAGKPAININGFLEGKNSKSHFGFLLLVPADGSYVHDYELGRVAVKDITAGTRKVSTGSLDLDFGGPNVMANKYDFESGHLVITSYEPKSDTLTGTFSGTLKNAEGKTLEITDGHLQSILVTN